MKYSLISLALSLLITPVMAQEAAMTNLLTNASSRILEHTLCDPGSIKYLFDGDRTTTFHTTTADLLPLRIVFGFKGQEVTPRRLLVRPAPAAGALPAQIELMGSLTSPKMGFFSMGVYRLPPGRAVYRFTIPPSVVRYVMLRLFETPDHQPVQLNEIELWGWQGREPCTYPFLSSPIDAQALLQKLAPQSQLRYRPQERELCEDARDGRLDHFSFAQAALIASGVPPQKQAAYLQRLEAIVQQLRQELAPRGFSAYQKAKYIFQYQHRFYLKKYRWDATDLHILLDTGEYNCASSSLFYNIIGRRLGLDLRGVEVPDHTFSILYDGLRHWDIETTTPAGFDPVNPQQMNSILQRQTGFKYISAKLRTQRRELTSLGQVAIIYYNRGLQCSQEGRFWASTANYLKALMLDKGFTSAVNNVLANFANQGIALSRQRRFADAVHILQTGLKLAGQDQTLRNNLLIVYHQWGHEALQADHYQAALEIFRQARQQFPAEPHFAANIAYIYFYQSQKRQQAGDLPGALQIMTRALQGTSQPQVRRYLIKARSQIFCAAARQQCRQRKWRQAIALCEQGLRYEPDNPDLRNAHNSVYLQWAIYQAHHQGLAAAAAVYREAQRHDPQEWRFRHNLKALYLNQAREQMLAKRYSQARQILEQLLKIYPDEPQAQHNLLYLYQTWTSHLLHQGAALQARDLYLQWRRDFPKQNCGPIFQGLFLNQGIQAATQGDYAQAATLNALVLAQFPDNTQARNNLLYAYEHWYQQLRQQKQYQRCGRLLLNLLQRFPAQQAIQQWGQPALLQTIREMLRQSGSHATCMELLVQLRRLSPENEQVTRVIGYYSGLVVREHLQHQDDSKIWQTYQRLQQRFGHLDIITSSCVNSLLNYSADLIKKQEYSRAVSLLEHSLSVFGHQAPLEHNLVYAYQQWFALLGRQQRYQEIVRFLQKRRPATASEHSSALCEGALRQASLLLQQRRYAAAALILAALQPHLGPQNATRQLLKYAFSRQAEELARRQQWSQALAVYQKALRFFPHDKLLQHNQAYCRQRLAASQKH